MAKKTSRKKATTRRAAPAAGTARKSTRRTPAPVVELQSECGIRDVAGLHQSLLALVDASALVTLDARRVDRVDASVLQVLGAFVRDRREAGREVAWKDAPSEAFLRAARLIDLDHVLGLDAAP